MFEDKDIGYLLHKADMTAKNYFTNKLNEYGITPGQYIVIREINAHKESTREDGLSPASIADRLECDRPTISGIIDRLEVQGWIERLQNPEDKRSCIIQLTVKAYDNIGELNKINKEHQNMILKGFTQEEIVMLKNYICRVMNNFKKLE